MLTLTIILALTLTLILTLINPNHNTNPNCYNAFPMAPSKLHSSPLFVWQLFTTWDNTCEAMLDLCLILFLANVNSSSCSLHAVARPSVICLSVIGNARAPYSGVSNFPQYFYGIWYIAHPMTYTENFTKIIPGEPLHRRS